MNYVEKEVKKLSPLARKIFSLLDKMIDPIYDAGVDVSFFPKEAELVLIDYAKKIEKLMT